MILSIATMCKLNNVSYCFFFIINTMYKLNNVSYFFFFIIITMCKLNNVTKLNGTEVESTWYFQSVRNKFFVNWKIKTSIIDVWEWTLFQYFIFYQTIDLKPNFHEIFISFLDAFAFFLSVVEITTHWYKYITPLQFSIWLESFMSAKTYG